MKGILVSGATPTGTASDKDDVYEDRYGETWSLTKGTAGSWAAKTIDADNRYKASTTRNTVVAVSLPMLVAAVDDYVDEWSAKATIPAAPSSGSGLGVLALILLVAFVFSDKKGR